MSKRIEDWKRGAAAAVMVLAAVACGGDTEAPETAFTRGERVYKNVCVACHAADPSLQGSLGPPIAGSSRELVEARVVHGEYPEGYEPKMPGALMPKFPHLAEAVDDLTAYLNDERWQE